MKLELDPIERYQILQLLPEKGDLIKMKCVKDINEKISYKQDDFEFYNIQPNEINNSLKFDTEKLKNKKEYEFTNPETQLLKDSVEQAIKNQNVTLKNIDVIDLIKNYTEQ